MKADEIRNHLKNWTKEDVIKLYTQTYRRVPKNIKEELDEVIQQGFGEKPKAAQQKKIVEKPNIDVLEAEINEFIDHAEAGEYYYANRAVSKKERSNWRFTAKRFFKSLCEFRPDDPEYDQSNILLCRMYDILGRATGFYTFTSQDPYHAVGYPSQVECFALIADRVKMSLTDNQEPLRELIRCGCNGRNDYETVDQSIHYVMTDLFKEEEELKQLQTVAEMEFEPIRQKYESRYKGSISFMITEDQIITHSKYDSLCWFVVATMMAQEHIREAYDFAMTVDPEDKKEIDLYCLLSYYIDSNDQWIEIYEMALKDGIKPRETLKEKYEAIKKRSK